MASFYFTPDGGSEVTLAMGECAVRIIEDNLLQVSDGAELAAGGQQLVVRGARRRVTLLFNPMQRRNATEIDRQEKMVALATHLRTGGRCAFALEEINAFGGFLSIEPVQGNTGSAWTGHLFPGPLGANAFTVGNYWTMEGTPPLVYEEEGQAGIGWTGVVTSYQRPLSLDWTGKGQTTIVVRHRFYYPALFMEAERAGEALYQWARSGLQRNYRLTLAVDFEEYQALNPGN